MVFITGDTHGALGVFDRFCSKNFKVGCGVTKKDYVIICGDFGVLFNPNRTATENNVLDWLHKKPWTTLFCDGNHDNHDLIKSLPSVPMFNDYVGKVNDSVFHLKRGHSYVIDNKMFFVVGGATSIDRHRRIDGLSWWPGECISNKEVELALDTLESVGNIVDYIITHTVPKNILETTLYNYISCPTSNFLQHVYDTVSYNKWFAGHLHLDEEIRNIRIIYNDIERLL
jgi:hypothetical protein